MNRFHAPSPETMPKTTHDARSRRAFLKLMGQAGTMAGFTRLLWPSVSQADTPPPLRMVALWTAHGRLDEFWVPHGGETDFDIDFTDASLQPLQPFRDQLLILDGIDYRVLYEHGTSGHDGGPVTFLTGSALNTSSGDSLPNSLSLDQYLAPLVASSTQFKSLQLMTYSAYGGQGVGDSISFTAGGVRAPWERDPRAVFNRVFAGLTGGGAPSAADMRALQRKKSLLDYLVKDATKLQSRLAGPEKAKLDAHLTALRDIENRITGMNNMAATTCAKPAQPAAQSSSVLGKIENVPANTKLMFDLATQALACDLTRFVTVPMIPQPTAPWLNLTEIIHDDLAHSVDDGDPTIRAKLNQFHRWNAEMVAYLLGDMKAIVDGSGTLLDHSLVLWGNELGDPSVHASTGVPTVLCGGVNGKFRMGRYLQLRPGKDPLHGWNGVGNKAPNAVAHNQLLVSIAQAFDQNVNTFGHTDYTGPLAGLV